MRHAHRSKTSRCLLLARGALVALGVAALTACAGGGSGGSGGRYVSAEERAARIDPQDEAFSTLGYQRSWRSFATILPRQEVEFFNVLGDAVVVQTDGALVSVIDATSGSFRWSDQVAGPLTRFVGNVRLGDRLAVSSESDVFFYDLTSSTLLDKQELARVANTRPVVAGDLLIYGTSTGIVLRHLVTNGFSLTGNSMNEPITTDGVLMGSIVGFADRSGDVLFIDAQSGSAVGFNRDAFGGPGAQPAGSDRSFFLPSLDHSLYAYDAASGQRLWRRLTPAPLRDAPTYHAGVVWVTLPELGLTALDADTGEERWNNTEVGGEVLGIRNGRLLVWDGSTMDLVDPATGDLLESVRLRDVTFVRLSKFEDGDMYTVSPNGVVARYTSQF